MAIMNPASVIMTSPARNKSATRNLFPWNAFTMLTTVIQTPTSVEAAGKM
jgi:hypothetical protein